MVRVQELVFEARWLEGFYVKNFLGCGVKFYPARYVV